MTLMEQWAFIRRSAKSLRSCGSLKLPERVRSNLVAEVKPAGPPNPAMRRANVVEDRWHDEGDWGRQRADWRDSNTPLHELTIDMMVGG